MFCQNQLEDVHRGWVGMLPQLRLPRSRPGGSEAQRSAGSRLATSSETHATRRSCTLISRPIYFTPNEVISPAFPRKCNPRRPLRASCCINTVADLHISTIYAPPRIALPCLFCPGTCRITHCQAHHHLSDAASAQVHRRAPCPAPSIKGWLPRLQVSARKVR